MFRRGGTGIAKWGLRLVPELSCLVVTACSGSSETCPAFHAARDKTQSLTGQPTPIRNGALSAALAGCSSLEAQIIWEDGDGTRTSYAHWPASKKARLDTLFDGIANGDSDLGLDCPDRKVNLWYDGAPVAGALFFTANQAFDAYAANVAHALYLEMNHLVPWSIFDHRRGELAEIFDSSRYYTRILANPYSATYPPGIVPGRDFWNAASRRAAAWEAVCDPRIGYEFLSGTLRGTQYSSSGERLLGPSEQETLANITWWFYQDVVHGPLTPAPGDQLSRIYLSDRLRPDASTRRITLTAGCHSAANLFHDLAQSVNIPLLHVATADPGSGNSVDIDANRHSGLIYGWEGGSPLTLEHVDDVYALFPSVSPTPPPGISPGSPEWLAWMRTFFFKSTWIPAATLDEWGYQGTSSDAPVGPDDPYADRGSGGAGLADQGVFAGWWPPNAAEDANLPTRSWGNYEFGLVFALCSWNNFVQMACQDHRIFDLQLQSWWSEYGESAIPVPTGWLSQFGEPGATIDLTNAWTRAEGCASSYGCANLTAADEAYLRRTSENYWTGPPNAR